MKKIIWAAVICCVLVSGCGQNEQEKSQVEEVKLKSNQEMIYGQIKSITGNDMTVVIARANGLTNDSSTKSSGQETVSDKTDINIDTQEPTKASSAGGGEPDFAPPENNQENTPSEIPSQADSSGKAAGEGAGNPPDTDKKRSENATRTYTLTGEEKEMRIPVGTVVTTALGANTTFSRLAAEDMLKIVVEQNEDGMQTILSIWIVG